MMSGLAAYDKVPRGAQPAARDLAALLAKIRQCRACDLPCGPRPVVQAAASARLLICGQAPGTRVHKSGKPFDDPSGDRLRAWLAIDRARFYDAERVAIIPMGFCFPGLNDKGADLPPRAECAPLWRAALLNQLPNIELTLLIGQYAQKWHLGNARKKTVTETVRVWETYWPDFSVLPHPSWRNSGWLKKNPWFERDIVPRLQDRVARLLA